MLTPSCLALLALPFLAAAFDQSCDQLVKPLDDQTQISGKWIYHVGTSDHPYLRTLQNYMDSSWFDIVQTPSGQGSVSCSDKLKGRCYYGREKVLYDGFSTETMFHLSPHRVTKHVGVFLVTCADCLLWHDTVTAKGYRGNVKGRYLWLLTKRGKLDEADLEVFKKQAACLNFPADFHFGDTADLCPAAPKRGTKGHSCDQP